jgi:hypothetical protein
VPRRAAETGAVTLIQRFGSALHVAPEKQLSQWLRSRSANYLSIDLYREATARMDITDLSVDDIQVPIWVQRTFEDQTKRTPKERLEAFYQSDHVRLYGLDIVERFEEAGFSSCTYRARDFGPEVLLESGLSFASTNEVFLFKKE